MSTLKERHKLELLQVTKRGRIGYYSCPPTVPRQIILKLAEEEKKSNKEYLAIHVKILDTAGHLNAVQLLQDNKNMKVATAVMLSYTKTNKLGLFFRNQKFLPGGTNVAKVYDQNVRQEFDHENPFSIKNVKQGMIYADNFDIKDIEDSSSQTVNPTFEDHPDATLDQTINAEHQGNIGRTFLQDRFDEIAKMESYLDTLKQGHPEISGITYPVFYIGFTFTTSSIHLEDLFIPSLNYLLKGSAPKYWIFMDAADLIRINEVLKGLKYNQFDCPQGAQHKYNYVSSEFLDDLGIKYEIVKQHENEMVITFPRGAHQVINSGKNVAVAMNWLYQSALVEIRSIPMCTCPMNIGFKWLWDAIRGSELPMRMEYRLKQLPAEVLERIEIAKSQIQDWHRNYAPKIRKSLAIQNVSQISQPSPVQDLSQVEHVLDEPIIEEESRLTQPSEPNLITINHGEDLIDSIIDENVEDSDKILPQQRTPSPVAESENEDKEHPSHEENRETIQHDDDNRSNLEFEQAQNTERVHEGTHALSSEEIETEDEEFNNRSNQEIEQSDQDVAQNSFMETVKQVIAYKPSEPLIDPSIGKPSQRPQRIVIPIMINEGYYLNQEIRESDKRALKTLARQHQARKPYEKPSVPVQKKYNKKLHSIRSKRNQNIKTLKNNLAKAATESDIQKLDVLHRSIEKTRETIISNEFEYLIVAACTKFPDDALNFHYEHGYEPFDVLRHFVDGTSENDRRRIWKVFEDEFHRRKEDNIGLKEGLREALQNWDIFAMNGPYDRVPARDPPVFKATYTEEDQDEDFENV